MSRAGDLFSTLSRKRLFQIALVYLGVAWAILEMTDFAIANYDLSRKLLDGCLFLLVLGLPAVLIIGWYHGEKGHQRVVRSELSLLLTLFVMAAVGTYRIATAEETAGTNLEVATPVESDARLASSPAADLGVHSVAVFPFRNETSDDSLTWLGPAIADMLTTNLAQLSDVRVVSRERLLGLLRDTGQNETDEIPRSLAGEIAARSGARLMVQGSILGTPDELAIDAQLIELDGGTVVAAERVRGTDFFAIVDSLSTRLCGEVLGPGAPEPLPLTPIAAVTTPKLDAYREFHEGVRAERLDRSAEARRRFEKAVELDSSFALAMLKLARTESLDPEEALRYMRLARKEFAKLPPEYQKPLKAVVELGGQSLAIVMDSLLDEALSEVRVALPRTGVSQRDTLPNP
jgi:TolB-like protein